MLTTRQAVAGERAATARLQLDSQTLGGQIQTTWRDLLARGPGFPRPCFKVTSRDVQIIIKLKLRFIKVEIRVALSIISIKKKVFRQMKTTRHYATCGG